MKELSIEQKAQAYDKAIERARIWKDKSGMPKDKQGILDDIFPELKESEDERIRKEMLQIAKESEDTFYMVMTPYKREKLIAWLEKQGDQNLANSAKTCKVEQKPADKVEPKFKVKYAGSEYNVLEVKDIAGVTYYGIEDEPNHVDYVQAENCERVDGYRIKESGSPFPTKPAKFSEQNPAWSEEDNEMLDSIIEEVRYMGDFPDYPTKEENELYDECLAKVEWLESLKDRVQPQPKQEWSEEDEKMFNRCVKTMKGAYYLDGEALYWLENRFKSIRPHSQWKPSKEQLEALEHSLGDYNIKVFEDRYKTLKSLYNDLKKLRED